MSSGLVASPFQSSPTGGVSAYPSICKAGDFSVVVDSVHHGKHLLEFLQRSFTDRNRFGKVVFIYV